MLKVKAMGEYPMPAGKDMELWLVMKDVPAPVSLGLLPHAGTMEKKLPPEMMPMIEHGVAVAVSMEPAGGSKTGLPTGPVVLSAPLVQS
jgi:anti-sigma-K factor RskA